MLASSLILASATIVFVLGTIHLYYTFTTNKFSPRDAALEARMREVPSVLTRDTSLWNMWMGFNGSHSLGAMLFGAVYGSLAGAQSQFLFSMKILVLTGALFLAGMLALAVKYWFSIPRNGIALSFVLYVAGCVIAYT